jgi:hypothetical protein
MNMKQQRTKINDSEDGYETLSDRDFEAQETTPFLAGSREPEPKHERYIAGMNLVLRMID